MCLRERGKKKFNNDFWPTLLSLMCLRERGGKLNSDFWSLRRCWSSFFKYVFCMTCLVDLDGRNLVDIRLRRGVLDRVLVAHTDLKHST